MNYTIGIDTGTTSVSIVAINEALKVIDSITVNHEAFIERGVQNPEKIREIVMASLESLTSKLGQPSAIGFTGQMHGILYINGKGKAVSPLYTWQDGSGSIPVDGKSSLEIFREHGLTCSSGYGTSTHFYLQRTGKIPADAVKFTTISDYIAMRLCGNTEPILSAEMAAGLGAFNVREKKFELEKLSAAGVDISFFPSVSEKCIVNQNRKNKFTILNSMGDNQASFKGSVEDPDKTLLLNIGTGSQVSFMTREFVDVSGDIELRPYGDAYLLAGSALCGGRAYAMLEGFYREIAGSSCYDIMARHAESFLKSQGLSQAWNVDTRFNGTRSDPSITGSITGITAENFCPGALTVGVIRGILEELRGMYELMKNLTGRSASVIVGSGNALRRNEVMRRLAGEIFGLEVKLTEGREEAARGAAMCAMEACAS